MVFSFNLRSVQTLNICRLTFQDSQKSFNVLKTFFLRILKKINQTNPLFDFYDTNLDEVFLTITQYNNQYSSLHVMVYRQWKTHLQAQAFNEPLITQEVAGHVNITVIHQTSDLACKELVLWFHCVVFTFEVLIDFITVGKNVNLVNLLFKNVLKNTSIFV